MSSTLIGRLKSPTIRGLGIGLACATLCIAMNQTQVMRNLENWALDSCYVYRGPRSSSADIVIVAIDDETLAETKKPLMYLSPELAAVTEHLLANGAAAVGVDLLVPEEVQAFGDFAACKPGDAALLGEVVSKYANVVLPMVAGGASEIRPLPQWLLTPPEYRPWHALGFIDLTPDRDMSVRNQQLITQRAADGTLLPSFALAVYGASLGGLSIAEDAARWLDQLPTGQSPFPTDASQRLQINFRGPAGTFPRVAFRDVLAESLQNAPQQRWQGKIVLIGPMAQSLGDTHPTPYFHRSLVSASAQEPAQLMAGVEIHANVIATLADRRFITTPWWLSASVLLLLTGSLLGVALSRASLESGVLLAFAHHWLWKAVGFVAFVSFGWHIEMVSVLLLGGMVISIVFALRWRWIRRTLGMIKSESIARALESDPSKMDLRGEDRVITVLFSDIRNFTTYSEGRTPREVVEMLNAYFGIVVPVLEQHGGTINQYVGDGLMVLFGAPEHATDHATRAVRGGLAMLEAVHRQQGLWNRLGAPDFRIGVGIHTGRVIVGTVGSKDRLDYTAIGDTTNTAARIESGCKELKTEILISAATLAGLVRTDAALLQRVGPACRLPLKGKAITVVVHTLSLGSQCPAANQLSDPSSTLEPQEITP